MEDVQFVIVCTSNQNNFFLVRVPPQRKITIRLKRYPIKKKNAKDHFPRTSSFFCYRFRAIIIAAWTHKKRMRNGAIVGTIIGTIILAIIAITIINAWLVCGPNWFEEIINAVKQAS